MFSQCSVNVSVFHLVVHRQHHHEGVRLVARHLLLNLQIIEQTSGKTLHTANISDFNHPSILFLILNS